jgi:CarD family transcriptional regulator
MSSVKKITKSPKARAARAKSEAGKSAGARGRLSKRGAEPTSKKAHMTATRTPPAKSKTAPAKKVVAKKVVTKKVVAKKASTKTTAKHAVATKAKALAKSRTSTARPTKAAASTKAKIVKAKRVPAAKVAARKPAAHSGATRKATTAKPAAKTTQLRNTKVKQSQLAKSAKLRADAAAAARKAASKLNTDKSVAAAVMQRRSKLVSAEEAKAVAKKVAAVLAARPQAKLGLRPLSDPQAAHDASGGKARAAVPPVRKEGGKPMLGAGKLQPAAKDLKPAEMMKTEIKATEMKPPERPGMTAKTIKPGTPKQGFKPMEFIVYPAHGVGQIIAIEEQEVAGFKLELFVISFVKDKMILKVPTPKSVSVGMRKLAGPEVVKRALNTLTGRARIKRTMWSRRAQEYEAKINSGDLVAIAEVVRDLYRSDAQPEQSYSERQLYEAALDRVAREIAVVQKLTETESLKLIESQLQKGPRRGKAEEAEAAAESEEGDIDEAA